MRVILRPLFLLCTCLLFSVISAYGVTYTTISNGNWTSPATWSGGVVPPTPTVNAGDTININHNVLFDAGTDISNFGTIRLERVLGGGPAWLRVPSNTKIDNFATGSIFVITARLIQCRFASCDNGEPYTGTTPDTDTQVGVWTNLRGYIEIRGSLVEVAQTWISQHGTRRIIDSCVFTGQDYQVNDANEEITNSLISVGWHGNGNFAVFGSATVTYTAARIQIAGATGNFQQTAVDMHSGDIDSILIRNQIGNFTGSGEIRNDPGMPGGPVVLDAYCAQSTAKYIPNGEFTLPAGTPPNCNVQPFCVATVVVVLIPTAAHVPVSGRVTTSSGQGIGGAVVTVTGGVLTAPVSARTNPFGYYSIPDLEVGRVYMIEVSSRRHQFSNPSVVFNLHDSITGMDFVADGFSSPAPVQTVKGRKP